MASYQFFTKHGPYPLKEIIKTIDCKTDHAQVKNFSIHGVESLLNAKQNEMTFLNSGKYKDISLKTKASVCITSPNLSKFLPKKCIKLEVKNVLLAVNQVSKMFYPKADSDYPDSITVFLLSARAVGARRIMAFNPAPRTRILWCKTELEEGICTFG